MFRCIYGAMGFVHGLSVILFNKKIMKKLLFLSTFLILCFYSVSHPKRDTMCDYIDDKEAILLNKLASAHGIEYDFTYKKVAFYTGEGAGARRNKEDFLPKCHHIDDGYNPNAFYSPRIYIFNEEEKKKSDEYDAVIVYGSVKQLPSKKTLIRRLHRFCRSKSMAKN